VAWLNNAAMSWTNNAITPVGAAWQYYFASQFGWCGQKVQILKINFGWVYF
jgi:hypothetical protein